MDINFYNFFIVLLFHTHKFIRHLFDTFNKDSWAFMKHIGYRGYLFRNQGYLVRIVLLCHYCNAKMVIL